MDECLRGVNRALECIRLAQAEGNQSAVLFWLESLTFWSNEANSAFLCGGA